MIDRDKYIAHIKDEDAIFEMRRLLDKIEMVMKNHTIESTDFLDPYLIRLSKSILNRFHEISYKEIGGFKESERKVILIYPEYHYLTEEREYVKALRLIGNMEDLSHPDFLGAVLGLGIKRDKIGDILIHEGYTDIIVKSEIEDFVLLNLKKIGNKKIQIKAIEFEKLRPMDLEFEELYRTLASLRLDAYISSVYNMSRSKGQTLVERGLVKVNWEPIDDPAYIIEEKDLISARRFGRSILWKIERKSKKDRYIANIRKII